MVIYSEDNKMTPSSQLLCITRTVHFTDGNDNIVGKVPDEANILIFVDVVPDSERLQNLYSRVVSYYKRAVVVPIPCTEFYIIRLLVRLGCVFEYKFAWVQTVLRYVMAKQTIRKPWPPKSIGYWGTFNSFEKQCKLVLHAIGNRYVNEKDFGYWYLNDSDNLNVITKSALLWTEFPFMGVANGSVAVDLSGYRDYVDKYLMWIQSGCTVKLSAEWWR